MLKLIKNNPYRFLGVFSNSPIRERVANANKLKAFLKVGKSLTFPLDIPSLLPALTRTSEGMESASACLNLPNDQIKHALFWFVVGSPMDKIALEHLQAGNVDKSVEILSKKESYSSLLNLGIIAAIKDDFGTFVANLTRVIHNDDYRAEFVKAVAGEEFQITETDLATLFIDSLQEEYSVSFLREQFSTYGDSLDDDELLNSRSVDEPKSAIFSAISEAKDAANTASAQYAAGEHLMLITKEPLALLKRLLSEDDMTYQTVADKLATQILQCGINYYNNSDEDEDQEIEKAYKLQHYALTIAAGRLVKDRCAENVAILDKKKKELAPKGVRFYDKKIKELLVLFITKPNKAAETIELVKSCAPYLFSIRDVLGSSDEYYLRMSTLVAQAGLSKVIDEFNSMMNDSLKIELLLNREETMAKLKRMFNDAWKATLYMEKLDMEVDFRTNRFNKQKAALCNQVDEVINVNISVRLDAKSDNQMFSSCNDVASFKKYLSVFSEGKHVAEAKVGLEKCEFEALSSTAACKEFREKYPNTKFNLSSKWEDLYYKETQGTIEGLNKYLKAYPNGKYVSAAKAWIEEEEFWQSCLRSEGSDMYKEYLAKYPSGHHRLEAEKKASACYIATMVYGDYNHPQVIALRGFRDDVLRSNALGQAFIRFYYKNSPSWVEKMQGHRSINAVIREMLNIFIKLYNHESK